MISFKKKLCYKPFISNRKSYLETKTSTYIQLLRILSGKTHHQIKLKPLREV